MKVAVVQEPPVFLDLSKTMERAIGLVEKSAKEGAQMMVFPEAWFPGYPTFVWRLAPGAGMGKTDELYARIQANAIDLSKNGLAPLQEAQTTWPLRRTRRIPPRRNRPKPQKARKTGSKPRFHQKNRVTAEHKQNLEPTSTSISLSFPTE